MAQTNSGKMIQSVQRAVDILNCFDDVDTELTLGQISQKLNLNKSTVHGILNTLHNNRFVQQNSEGKYLLGQALLNKGKLARSTRRRLFLDVSRQLISELSNQYKATGNLFLVEDGIPALLQQIQPSNGIYIVSHVSDDDPLYCTATGKLTLAFMKPEALDHYLSKTQLLPSSSFTITEEQALRSNLQEIRECGYSYENEELVEGVSAISAPVFDQKKQLFGTISITGLSFHIVRNHRSIAEDLKRTSREISRKLLGQSLFVCDLGS